MKITIDQALQKAIEAHKAGKAQEADKLYTAILKAQPKHPDANHNIGILAVSLGKVQEALPFFKTALETKTDTAQFWISYINALIKLDKLHQAKDMLNCAKISCNKGNSFDQIENILKPVTDPKEEPSESDEPSEELVQILNNLNEDKQFNQVILQIKELQDDFPRSAELNNILGLAYFNIHDYKNSAKHFEESILLKPSFYKAHNNLANLTLLDGNVDAAVSGYQTALKFKPDFEQALNNLGNAYKAKGKIKDARQAYEKALYFKPYYSGAHRNLSSVTRYRKENQQFKTVERLLSARSTNDKDRCQLHYAYAKMQEDLGNYKLAFDNYVSGGHFRKKSLQYHISQDTKLFLKIESTARKITKLPLSVSNKISNIPIFILGMPRSGTTLIEQIISCHSDVTAAGEMDTLNRLSSYFHLNVGTDSVNVLSKIRKIYLNDLSNRSNGKRFVSDKMPHNFLHIGLICQAFPEAKIIHTKRLPEATCWSNFKHYFETQNLGYSYDLEDIVKYFKLYQNLMSFWDTFHSDRIYHLDYEKLTSDPEKQIPKLINSLSLKWEDECLFPQQKSRYIMTSSQIQANQKIYKGSSSNWSKFKPFLGNSLDSLKKK